MFHSARAACRLLSTGWIMRKARILVVDDEQNARAALRTLLSEEGYEITEAQDGEEGLSKLQDIAPDVVLADVRMPRMDGLTLLRKSKELGSDATFLMMTAFASIEAAVEAMKAGAENYLVKPLDVRAVLVFLQKALEKRRLVQEAEMLRERVRCAPSTKSSARLRLPRRRCWCWANQEPARSSLRRRSTSSPHARMALS